MNLLENSKAFNLLETCIALILISVICYLNSYVLLSVTNFSNYKIDYYLYYDASLISRECSLYDYIDFDSKSLLINKNSSTIIYIISESKISRSVDTKGYTLVGKVNQDYVFIKKDNMLYLSNGEEDAFICK